MIGYYRCDADEWIGWHVDRHAYVRHLATHRVYRVDLPVGRFLTIMDALPMIVEEWL